MKNTEEKRVWYQKPTLGDKAKWVNGRLRSGAERSSFRIPT
jgi:hypothetical protein